MIILHEGQSGVVVTSIGETARPADIIHHPAVLAEDGEDIISAAWDETVTPAETQVEFAARMVAAHVPEGARHVIADPATLPTDAPPERWSVDWATGAVTVLPVPVVVPEVVGLWAAQAVLAQHGLYDAVNAFALAQKSTNPVIFFAWTMGNTLSRHGAFVTALGPQFGLTSTQIDAMFIEANAIAF